MSRTNPQQSERAVRALQGLLHDLPDVPLPVRRRGRPPVGPLLVAAAVTLVLLLLPLHVAERDRSPAATGTHAVLPDPFPAYAHVPATVERLPAGPASMVFTHGSGVEFLDHPQAIALGADGTSYRRLDTADDASVPSDQGDPGPILLSPDGRTVAVGGRGGEGDLFTVSLEDGSVRTWPLPEGRSSVPLGWSADSQSVFVGLVEGVYDRYAGLSSASLLAVDDVRRVDLSAAEGTGPTPLPDVSSVTGVAPLPDGEGVLVAGTAGTELRSPDGMRVVAKDLDLGPDLGPAAVSPDGRSVVTGSRGELRVNTLADGTVTSTYYLDLRATEGSNEVALTAEPLGWLGEDRILVSAYQETGSTNRLHLWSVDAGTGSTTELLVAEPGWTGASIVEVSIAADLLDGAEVSDPGPIDRGRAGLALRAALLLALVVLTVRAAMQLRSVRRDR